MRDTENVFHLAIPCACLDSAAKFYTEQLGCRLARRYDDRITLNFFGDQIVCHLSPDKIDQEPKMYPRHFGVTFRHRQAFDETIERARAHGLRFFAEPFVRFEGERAEHVTFFLVDPSNNLLEFEYYLDPEMMY